MKWILLSIFGLVGWALVFDLWPTMSNRDQSVGIALVVGAASALLLYTVLLIRRK